MRPSSLVLIALVAAAVGGLVSLLVADRAGLVDGGADTVFVGGSGGTLPVEREIEAPARPLAGNAFDPVTIYQSRSGGVVTIYAYFEDRPPAEHAAQGSGFVISREGYILTSAHVVTTAGPDDQSRSEPEAADSVFVGFRDRDRVEAAVIGWDVFDDVAVLKVDPNAHALDPVPLGDSGRVVVGEPVAALGSPFGNESSLSVGVVSATRRSIASLTSGYDVADAIQTDAPITHGNSGGPLFDARGRVIGINAQIRSDSGQSQGVGFAIPINAAKRSFRQLVRNGRVAYAYVGINAEDLTPTIAKEFGYPVDRGAVIATVVPESPGQKAGLRGGGDRRTLNGFEFRVGGDVVVRIGSRNVRSATDLVRIVSERLSPGQEIDFTILRDGQRMVVPVTLGERPRRPVVRD